jgi:hypothetical protein
VHEAVDTLALTNERNLLLPYLITHIALARVPGAGAVEEPKNPYRSATNSIPGVADARASRSL